MGHPPPITFGLVPMSLPTTSLVSGLLYETLKHMKTETEWPWLKQWWIMSVCFNHGRVKGEWRVLMHYISGFVSISLRYVNLCNLIKSHMNNLTLDPHPTLHSTNHSKLRMYSLNIRYSPTTLLSLLLLERNVSRSVWTVFVEPNCPE